MWTGLYRYVYLGTDFTPDRIYEYAMNATENLKSREKEKLIASRRTRREQKEQREQQERMEKEEKRAQAWKDSRKDRPIITIEGPTAWFPPRSTHSSGSAC